MGTQLELDILRMLRHCRILLYICVGIMFALFLLICYVDVAKAQTRDDYYRENSESEYYSRHYRHHYEDYYVDDCCPDRDRERMKDREDSRRERWDEQYKNILRDQDVEEGMLVW